MPSLVVGLSLPPLPPLFLMFALPWLRPALLSLSVALLAVMRSSCLLRFLVRFLSRLSVVSLRFLSPGAVFFPAFLRFLWFPRLLLRVARLRGLRLISSVFLRLPVLLLALVLWLGLRPPVAWFSLRHLLLVVLCWLARLPCLVGCLSLRLGAGSLVWMRCRPWVRVRGLRLLCLMGLLSGLLPPVRCSSLPGARSLFTGARLHHYFSQAAL
jgi:hypothetical protein